VHTVFYHLTHNGEYSTMSDIIERIKELEATERYAESLQIRILELEHFIVAWDSGDPDELPAKRLSQIKPVRDLVNLIKGHTKPMLTVYY
jgi:hypothetical protein